MEAVEGRHAAVSIAGGGAQDPRPGPGDDRIPAELCRRGVEGADHADRLPLAAVSLPGRDLINDQPAFAERRDVARQRPRQRAAWGLHVADPELSPGLRGGPDGRRQWPWSWKTSTGIRRAGRGGAPAGASIGSTACWSEL